MRKMKMFAIWLGFAVMFVPIASVIIYFSLLFSSLFEAPWSGLTLGTIVTIYWYLETVNLFLEKHE